IENGGEALPGSLPCTGGNRVPTDEDTEVDSRPCEDHGKVGHPGIMGNVRGLDLQTTGSDPQSKHEAPRDGEPEGKATSEQCGDVGNLVSHGSRIAYSAHYDNWGLRAPPPTQSGGEQE